MQSTQFDEESRALLRQILERQAYRQLMSANIRGHGLRFLPDLEDKQRFVKELDFSLRILREIERIYESIDGEDLHLAVRERMERIPYPESRVELAVCLALTERAERVAARSYVDCVFKDFAAIAKTLLGVDRSDRGREERLLSEFCAEEGQLPQAQQYWTRWLAISLRSLGRPGTRGDSRAVALRLRSKYCGTVIRAYLDGLEPLREECGLKLPAMDDIGVELPEDLRARFATQTRDSK